MQIMGFEASVTEQKDQVNTPNVLWLEQRSQWTEIIPKQNVTVSEGTNHVYMKIAYVFT